MSSSHDFDHRSGVNHHRAPQTEADFEALIPCYIEGCLPRSTKDIFSERLARSPGLQHKIVAFIAAGNSQQEPFIARLVASPDLQQRVLSRLDVELSRCVAGAGAHRKHSIWTRLAHSFRVTDDQPAGGVALARSSRGHTARENWRDQIVEIGHRFVGSLGMPRLAAAALAVAVIEAGLIAAGANGLWFAPSGEYVTLSQTPSRSGPALPQFFVRFADAAAMNDISHVLQNAGLEIVSGPDAQGLYIVKSRAAAAGAEGRDLALSGLLSRPDLITAVLDLGR